MITGPIQNQVNAVWNVFPEGKDGGRSYDDFRWSRFKHFEPKEMYALVTDVAPHGPSGLFSSAQVVELMAVLDRIRRSAAA